MRSVGVRELKNKLSEYLRLVRAGEQVLITDRGHVIAQLSPPGDSALDSVPPEFRDLVRRGLMKPGGRNDPANYPKFKRVTKPGTAQRLLDQERGER